MPWGRNCVRWPMAEPLRDGWKTWPAGFWPMPARAPREGSADRKPAPRTGGWSRWRIPGDGAGNRHPGTPDPARIAGAGPSRSRIRAQLRGQGLATLRNAGKEGGWTLNESTGGNARLAGNERETLEAAMHVERTLDRAGNGYSGSRRPANALEQAVDGGRCAHDGGADRSCRRRLAGRGGAAGPAQSRGRGARRRGRT